MNHPRPERPSGMVEWIKTVGIICGGMIATGTVLHALGLTAYSAAMIPVRREVSVAVDSLSAKIAREGDLRADGDSTVRVQFMSSHREIMNELHDIRALLVRGRGNR